MRRGTLDCEQDIDGEGATNHKYLILISILFFSY